MGKILSVLVMLLLLFTFAGNSQAGSKFTGSWAWLQHSTGFSGGTSLCTGDLQVRKDGTFTIWNACKRNDNDCYVIEGASGRWEMVHKTGVFRAGYGNYFYDVIVKGNIAFFQSMSVSDNWDRGNMEYGSMLKGLNIDKLKAYYNSLQCVPEVIVEPVVEDPIVTEPEPDTSSGKHILPFY